MSEKFLFYHGGEKMCRLWRYDNRGYLFGMWRTASSGTNRTNTGTRANTGTGGTSSRADTGTGRRSEII
jgi:hypothetical protein